MTHLPEIISDLALILIAASVVSVLFRKLKQPVVLGYLIAGVLVGRHFPFFPTIADPRSVNLWAEIGVIFLLFALGLEFSFKKLARVGGAASITAIVEVAAMVGIGFATGKLLGWNGMDSLFLGGILAISSTTIILRAFDESGVKGRRFVQLVFGALIVEDLVAIVLLVLLSTLAVSQGEAAGPQIVTSVLKLVFFLTLWFLGGIFLIPSLLKRFRAFVNEETLLVVSIGLCFLMVVLATQAGFSPALGAFIMGSILAETTEAERIEHLVKPVKDLFAAIFFVSVGMMIQPGLLLEHAIPVIVITLVTLIGKTLSTVAGALLAGQSLRHSVQAGFSLAQIGEFSFIIAGLGLSLKVTSDFLYPIAIGVSAATTFTTPYMIRNADRMVTFIERVLPQAWQDRIARYGAETLSTSRSAAWPALLKSTLSRVLVNAVIVIALFQASARWLPRTLAKVIADSPYLQYASLAIAAVLALPFLWAMAVSRPNPALFERLWKDRTHRGPIVALEGLRILSAVLLAGFLTAQAVSLQAAAIVMACLAGVIPFVFSRRLNSIYHSIEGRFVQNLTERETQARQENPPLAPWDVHIAQLKVEPESPVVGKTLLEIGVREKFGVTIARIDRGSLRINAPGADTRLYPFDRLFVIGSDEQIVAFRPQIEDGDASARDSGNPENYALQPYSVGPDSPFVDKTIRELGLRERASALVVGIEREGNRLLNPAAHLMVRTGDVLWIVGDQLRIRHLSDSFPTRNP